MYTNLQEGKLRHYDQQALNDAFDLAIKGHGDGAKRWAFSDGNRGEITALEAASIAARYLHDAPSQRTLPRVSVAA